MYADLPPDVRDRHPYHMYEEIKAQPDAVGRSVQLVQEQGLAISRVIAGCRRVFLTGCGTSFHAAQGGAWFFQTLSRGRIDARAVEAYELVTYVPGIRPDDVVVGVTHSGATTMTLRALERAVEVGAETVVVTGFPESAAGQLARHLVTTGYNAERSWAHTVSYTAALASMLALANTLAEPEERMDLTPLPDVVRDALGLEEMAHNLAANTIMLERYREPTRISLVGAGPHQVTAREAALKLLETSYAQASAFGLEEMLHGPLAAITPDALLIVVAPTGRSVERASELTRAADALEVVPVVLTGSENANAFPDAHRLLLPDIPEVLSMLSAIVPLQLFSYFLAVGKDINPDLIHRDDERFRAARASYA